MFRGPEGNNEILNEKANDFAAIIFADDKEKTDRQIEELKPIIKAAAHSFFSFSPESAQGVLIFRNGKHETRMQIERKRDKQLMTASVAIDSNGKPNQNILISFHTCKIKTYGDWSIEISEYKEDNSYPDKLMLIMSDGSFMITSI
ncbi:hypothetical protein KW795_01805 [Candidatus Microgenomates bacterium]|nr:hypothetical protein [Candidatus Microgenomates bacterium]